MSTPEGKIQLEILKFLRGKGFFCWRNNTTGLWDAKLNIYRNNPYAINGVSDIIVILQVNDFSVTVWLEIKTKKNNLSADQVLFKKRIEILKGFYFEVTSVKETQECIDFVYEETLRKLQNYISDKSS